jgi:hypothetical protein
LLVSRCGLTTRKAIERAHHVLTSVPDTRISVILNDADRGSASYADYFGYSGSTYYETI